MDVEGLDCTFAGGTLGRGGAEGAHRVGRVRGLVGMLHKGRLGSIPPGRSAVGGGVDGVPQVQGYLRGPRKALRPEEQVQQSQYCRWVLRRAGWRDPQRQHKSTGRFLTDGPKMDYGPIST